MRVKHKNHIYWLLPFYGEIVYNRLTRRTVLWLGSRSYVLRKGI